MEDDFIVIILSCSSFLESRYLNLPASLFEMMLFDDMRQSDSVVFPKKKKNLFKREIFLEYWEARFDL